MILFFTILFAAIILPVAAQAEPVTLALTSFFVSVGASAFTAAILTTVVTQVAFGVALSLVAQLFSKTPTGIKPQGIQTEQTTSGDVTPQKFIVGRYACEGHAVAPAYSRGDDNSILTYIIEVSNIPVTGLTGRLIVDGQYTDLSVGADDATRLDFETLGFDEAGNPYGWLWFFDGNQTTAHSVTVENYSNHPDRPWTNDHILAGTAYSILEFRLNKEIYSGLPSVRFELDGIDLYDPRKDTTVGGSGAHRWDTPSTWEFSQNPQVISYNILRGITLPTGDIYGGKVDAADLPLDNWFAAMNECDLLIGTRPQYQVGFEINVGTMEPFEVIEEMNRSSFAQMSEFGGVFRVRVGAPSSPVISVTDDDFVITEPSRFVPFPGLSETFNAITGTYVEPVDVWEARSSDAIFNPSWETEDGDRRLTLNVNLPAVSNKSQVQHLMNSYIQDQRRFRVHEMVLPPSYALIEPLDTISFTSEINGYENKVFEVLKVQTRPRTLNSSVTVREREAGDVAWTSSDDVAVTSPTNVLTLIDANIPSLSVSAFSILDGDGVARRPGISLSWPSEEAPSAETLKYQIRLSLTEVAVTNGIVSSREGSTSTMDSILPNTIYDVRAQYISALPGAWTPWLEVTTSSIFLGPNDIINSLTDKIDTAFDRHDIALETITSGSVFQLLNEVRIEDAILAAQAVTNSASIVIRQENHESNAALNFINTQNLEINTAAITTEQTTRADAVSSLASSITTLIATTDDNAAAIITEQTTRTTAVDAVASSVTSLAVSVGDNAAGLVTEQTTRADADSATATEITTLTATTGDNAAAIITTIESTKVTAAEAVSAVEQTISASYGDLEAMAVATAFAKATADSIEAGYVWRVNNENLLELVSVADGTSGSTSTFKIDADYLEITSLTQIDQAVIDTLAVENGFITNLIVTKLSVGDTTTGVTINTSSKPNAVYVYQNSSTTYALYATNSISGGGVSLIESDGGFSLQVLNSTDGSGSFGAFCAVDAQHTASGGGKAKLGVSSAGGGYGVEAIAGGFYDSSGDGYSPFTGKHEGMISKSEVFELGDIVADGQIVSKSLSDVFTEFLITDQENMSNAVGVLASVITEWSNPASFLINTPNDSTFRPTPEKPAQDVVTSHNIADYSNDFNMARINSVGEGCINVCGHGGDIVAGDLISTSAIRGKGQKQSDDIVRSSTVAKSRESVTFSQPSQIKQIACIYMCG
jgi:hypothetical protein